MDKMTEFEKEDVKLVAEQKIAWDKLTNKTILISGGTGFIGSFIIEVLRYRNQYYNQGLKVISISRKGGMSDSMVEYLKADIVKQLQFDEPIDFILHLASNTHPKQYGEDPVGTILTNVLGCNNLLQLAVKQKIERFLLASSVEIYGEAKEKLISEDYVGYVNCNDARSGYNEAKRTCEALCQSYKMQYGVDIVITRLARIFGADHKEDSKAMAQFMDRAVLEKDIILKSEGMQRYSYCYLADAASGILHVLLTGTSGEAYNISEDDESMTLGEYAAFVASLANKKVIKKIENNTNVSKAVYALMDTKKIKEIGWNPLYRVSEGLKRTYSIYKER